MKKRCLSFYGLWAWIFSFTSLAVSAQNPAPGEFWQYRLLEGSVLTRDSLIGGPPTIELALRGTIELTLVTENPVFAIHSLTNIDLATPGGVLPEYRISGTGTYQVGGEVALLQDMRLDTQLTTASGSEPKTFTNEVRWVTRRWPVLEIELVQTDPNLLIFYRLHLRAAPVRDLWFSTWGGMTPGHWEAPTNQVSGGDWLRFDGRIVKRNADLTRGLGLMPMVPDLGLAAAEVSAGAEILWASDQAVFSESLGFIQQGDLLSNRGQIVRKNQALLAAFGIEAKAPDAGLDALQREATGEVLFSLRTNVYSPALGVMLGRGDLLSDQGHRLKTNAELLARFQPTDSKVDWGLDALYRWPNGEVWFSVEEGFMDQGLGPITSGDLLSDDGYVVYRNLELVGAFQPLEDVSNFGLDALFIVTDALTTLPAPRISGLQTEGNSGRLTIRWEGKGKVFQIEKNATVTGPYVPVGLIVPELEYNDTWAREKTPQSFYRVRQW